MNARAVLEAKAQELLQRGMNPEDPRFRAILEHTAKRIELGAGGQADQYHYVQEDKQLGPVGAMNNQQVQAAIDDMGPSDFYQQLSDQGMGMTSMIMGSPTRTQVSQEQKESMPGAMGASMPSDLDPGQRLGMARQQARKAGMTGMDIREALEMMGKGEQDAAMQKPIHLPAGSPGYQNSGDLALSRIDGGPMRNYWDHRTNDQAMLLELLAQSLMGGRR